MRTLLPTVLAVLLVGCSPANKSPLSVQLPANWKAQHKISEGDDFYTITAKTRADGLLMFSTWPPASGPENIPALVKTLADEFLKEAKKSPELTLVSESYQVEQFGGGVCHGSYATLQFSRGGANILQAVFVMEVDGRIWNGQFTGPPDAWKQALTVLKDLKKNG
jgi:hypothetical protein